jgi:hypothetical protein
MPIANLFCGSLLYVHVPSAATSIEDYRTFHGREKRIVFSSAHVASRVELRAVLAHKDFTGFDYLPAISLYSTSLAM